MANKNPKKYMGNLSLTLAHLVDVQLGSTRMPGLGILMVFYGFATIKNDNPDCSNVLYVHFMWGHDPSCLIVVN